MKAREKWMEEYSPLNWNNPIYLDEEAFCEGYGTIKMVCYK